MNQKNEFDQLIGYPIEYIFDELQFRRCEWKCDSLNQASRNAA